MKKKNLILIVVITLIVAFVAYFYLKAKVKNKAVNSKSENSRKDEKTKLATILALTKLQEEQQRYKDREALRKKNMDFIING